MKMDSNERNPGRGGRLWGVVCLVGLALTNGVSCYGQDCSTYTYPVGDGSGKHGTLTYGAPPVSTPFADTADVAAADACILSLKNCSGVTFASRGGPVNVSIVVSPFENGKEITLPSPDITVSAVVSDTLAGIPFDGGDGNEPLTLVSGDITVMVSQYNFEALFDMVFTRPKGGSVTIQNADVALLNAKLATGQSCK